MTAAVNTDNTSETEACDNPLVKVELSREQEAQRIVSKYVGWSVGAGAVFVPVLDIAAIAAVQISMLNELHDLYESSFSKKRARSTISLLLGSLSPRLLLGLTATSFIKFFPGVGHIIAGVSLPIFSGAATYAVGKTMVSHFETGGNMQTFDAKMASAFFKTAFEEGKEKAASSMAQKA